MLSFGIMTNGINFRYDRFKKLLKQRGYEDKSQEEIARDFSEKTGLPVHQTSISKFLKGERSPGGKKLASWAEFLETNVDYLLGLTNDEKPAADLEDQVIFGVRNPERREAIQDIADMINDLTPDQLDLVRSLLKEMKPKRPRIIGGEG